MFIRTVTKKNKYSPKVFQYQCLVESIRTDTGPRQKFLLNLGKLDLPEEEWPLLAKRIEEIIRGQERLFAGKPEIERLASEYAQKFIRKYELEYSETDEKHYETVDVDSLEQTRTRTIGAEYVSYSYLKKLKLDKCLSDCNFSKRDLEVAILLIIGRLVSPGSERHIHQWAQQISGVDELLGTDFSQLSLNTLYQVSDKLEENKETIERHLRQRERDLFGLDEKIIFYDLTNTFFEGEAAGNPKAKFGKSKEKRSDCRLLTLGLVIDSYGFPKKSKVFAGNQSEPVTLSEMIEELREGFLKESDFPQDSEKVTVILDAGIATEANLKALRDSYNYICVSRKKMDPPPNSDDLVLIKADKKNKIEARRIKRDGEVFLYCKSRLKAKKEQSIQSRFEQLFEEQMKQIEESIHKKGGTKKYDKVLERIGRLKEKYKRISRFYDITVEEKDGFAKKITWHYVKEQSDNKFSGSYYLRTNREDLREKQMWQIYAMLNELEDAFRTLKSELDLRPIHHQKEIRSDSHIFIAVIAYHILHSIRTRLKQVGLNYRWSTIRKFLSTHTRISNRQNTKDGKTIHIRKCSHPEPFHKTIYNALHLDYTPCKQKKLIVK
jgi:hypothetical protein